MNTGIFTNISVSLTLIVATQSLAVGLRLPNQDPEAIARGNAFVATADNPSAIYHNPAGITQLEGQQLSIGAYLISTDVSFESPVGVTGNTDSTIQAVPQIHYVLSPENSDFSYGFGVYVPYGLSIDYGDSSPFPTLAEEGSLTYLTLNPVLAYQVNDSLSLGIGMTINLSEVELSSQIGLLPGDEFSYEGDAVAYGFNLGLLWDISSRVSFGANYRSETSFDYEGSSLSSSSPFVSDYVATDFSATFPQYVDFGIAYRPNDIWTFEANIDWTDWEVLDSPVFEGTGFGDVPFNFNYDSSLMYEFGVTKRFSSGLLLSGGYIYSENSAPDLNFTPLNPDSNLHLGSIGIAKRGEGLGWALGYHFAYNSGREVSGNQTGSFIGEVADGRYETLNHAINFSIRKSF